MSSKNLKKKCQETKCAKHVSNMLSQSKNLLKVASKTIQASKKYLNDADLEKRKAAKDTIKRWTSIKKRMSVPGYFQKTAKREMRICKRLYCNPGCAKTSVKRSDVYENNFNKNIGKKLLRKLQKDGAISGCITIL